jgi:hypothetical protein
MIRGTRQLLARVSFSVQIVAQHVALSAYVSIREHT